MPRIERTPKEREAFLIRQFLKAAGYRVSRPRWRRESPDSILTIHKGTSKKRIGIEHTDYYNDAPHGVPSPGALLHKFWKLVLASLVRRLCHRPSLHSLLVSVRFKDKLPAPPPTRQGRICLARELAGELVGLALRTPVQRGRALVVQNRSFGSPRLSTLISSVMFLSARGMSWSRLNWRCSNEIAGGVAAILDHIVAAVCNKTNKAAKYDWDDSEERWLLITAAGDILSQRGGPAHQHVAWNRQDLRNACIRSGFDRIVYYAYPSWYKELWPGAPLVEITAP